MSKNTTYYGIFYKSRGRWTGPYNQVSFNERERNQMVSRGELKSLASYLKSKVSFRKL